MKKLDKLILQSFINPFLLTFLVVVFILLNVQMLKYFDDIIGKGLEWSTIGQLLFYFAIFTAPTALPLAVLLSSLIAFGNLGEHFELTAIKASGVSLLRVLLPIFIFSAILTAIAFHINNYLVPKAALEAYSLLYDIKQKKPALEIREGSFYNGIPDVSLKVNKKFRNDEAALKGVLIYDHRKNEGNKEVIVADSGRMYTFLNDQYLKLELYNGYSYAEGSATEKNMTGQTQKSTNKETLSRTRFSKSQVVFDLSSFQLKRTDQKWFQGDRNVRNLSQLQTDIDSLNELTLNHQLMYYRGRSVFFTYYQRHDSLPLPPDVEVFAAYKDSVDKAPKQTFDKLEISEKMKFKKYKQLIRATPVSAKSKLKPKRLSIQVYDSHKMDIDSMIQSLPTFSHIQSAASYARQTKTQITNNNENIESIRMSNAVFEIQWHKIISNSFACVVMFLIGAPLGSIIKRGGLGVPFLVSIMFFIIFYLLTMQGEKWAKNGAISAGMGVWSANVILLCTGLIFLYQARIDARLFEADSYRVMVDRLKKRIQGLQIRGKQE